MAFGAVQQIPGSIVRAIAEVMKTVTAVKKSQRNQHGGYNYASTDDIYAAVTLKMGEVGLIALSMEESCEIKRVETTDSKTGQPKIGQWAQIVFTMMLATEEASWTDDKFKRTLVIQVTGPQTFQSAQSFFEKEMLRSIFKIPTGDQDLDAMPQAESEEDQLALNAKPKRKSSSAAKKEGDDAVFNEIRRHISHATSADVLRSLRTSYAEEWNAMPSRWVEILDQEYEDAMGSHMDRVS